MEWIKKYSFQPADYFIHEEEKIHYWDKQIAFSAKDVALGHSYFIAEKKKISEDNKQEYFNMKMKYEVIPILNEYLKDGVFNEKATVKIKEIEQRFA